MRKYLLLLLLVAGPAFAAPAITPAAITTYIPNAGLVGQGRMHYMAWDVYDATLYAPQGKYDAKKPLALNLRYLRSLKGSVIAQRSVQEMRDQGFNDEAALANWQKQMTHIFPDVQKGTVLTGILTSKGRTVFLKNGAPIGSVNDQGFGPRFFAIWLDAKTSTPDLRKNLLGQL